MLASSAALRLVPGAKPQPLHRDHIAYLTRHNPDDPLYTPMIGCLIAGSKCTRRNGATAVIPGSHLWDDSRAPKVEECAYAEMEAGSALFTLGSTYHGAGENRCELEEEHSLRTIFAVFGQRDYYRQDQEEILSTPIEVVRQLPEDILKLCGFCEYTVKFRMPELSSSQGRDGRWLCRRSPISSRVHQHRLRDGPFHQGASDDCTPDPSRVIGVARATASMIISTHGFDSMQGTLSMPLGEVEKSIRRLLMWHCNLRCMTIHVPIYTVETDTTPQP